MHARWSFVFHVLLHRVHACIVLSGRMNLGGDLVYTMQARVHDIVYMTCVCNDAPLWIIIQTRVQCHSTCVVCAMTLCTCMYVCMTN